MLHTPADIAPAPLRAGIRLSRRRRAAAIEGEAGEAVWFEILAESYIGVEEEIEALERLGERYPLSVHGASLGLGGERALDVGHLERLRGLLERLRPVLFSEHLAWASHHVPELRDHLPSPYDEATLDRATRHIEQTQEALGRPLLLENPSSHIRLANSTMTETAFLSALVARTGCGLLLDLTNVVVSAATHSDSAEAYLEGFPLQAVGEIHLGGYDEALDPEGEALLPPAEQASTPEAVWTLYERVLAAIGPCPTVIEWDGPGPDPAAIDLEAARANGLLLAAERAPA